MAVTESTVEHISNIYDVFMETRQWAIDQGNENPVHTAIMRVVIEELLTCTVPSLIELRGKIRALVLMSKKIEFISGGVAMISQATEKKMAETRKMLEPFTVFDDLTDGCLDCEALGKMTTVTAKVVEVVAGHFGKNLNNFDQMSEGSLRYLSAKFADTIVAGEEIVCDKLRSSLDFLGDRLTKAGNNLNQNASWDLPLRDRVQPLTITRLGSWASTAANALNGQPPPDEARTNKLVRANLAEQSIKMNPSLVTPYYVTLPETSLPISNPKAQRAGKGITIGAVTIGGAAAYGISTTTSSGIVVSAGATLQGLGLSVSAPLTAVALPLAGGALVGYQLVQFYNDFELTRKYPYHHLKPMTDEELTDVRTKLLRLHGVWDIKLSPEKMNTLNQLIMDLHKQCQKLGNAINRTKRRKKTSWVGSFVRVAAASVSGSDSGTVKSAKRSEHHCREKITKIQQDIDALLKGRTAT